MGAIRYAASKRVEPVVLILRLILLTILIPGTVTVVVPYFITQWYPGKMDFGLLGYAGVFLIVVGVGFYLTSAVAFLVEGNGTPAIWFTKRLRFLIGEEPESLVRTKLYRLTRNPMYLGATMIVLGEAILFEKLALFVYSGLLWLYFHLVVVFVEEPHLRSKSGPAYDAFCSSIPRWIGFRVKRQ